LGRLHGRCAPMQARSACNQAGAVWLHVCKRVRVC
jgi:hypothetical protein